MPHYEAPRDLATALALLKRQPWRILAGGTDFYPALGARPVETDVLDISCVPGLRGVSESEGHWRIGAMTTWRDIIDAPLPPLFDGYKQAAREVGGMQVQQTGTLGGNLCNASPAADGTPNLIALDAEAELASDTGIRRLPVRNFVAGNRKTLRRPDEILTALIVPRRERSARSVFLKLGARKYLVISIVMVAGNLKLAADGTVDELRLCIGACSAVPVRLTQLEARATGMRADSAAADIVARDDLAGLSPIDDVRAPREYRLDAGLELTRRALAMLASQRGATA